MNRFNQLLTAFMKSKSEWLERALSIPRELYFTDGDMDEIMEWKGDEAEKIWKKIRSNIRKNRCSGLRSEFCPFCYYYGYHHRGCGSVIHGNSANGDSFRKRDVCDTCGYGVRHGICARGNMNSDFWKIHEIIARERIDIFRFFSHSYYTALIEDLEEKYLHKKAKR